MMSDTPHHRVMNRVRTHCAICDAEREFSSGDDYWSCRAELQAPDCPLNGCIPRQRALARALFSLFSKDRVKEMVIHESSPGPNGISLWLRRNCANYVMSGYFPDHPRGNMVRGFRNEDLEKQTFEDGTFDLVLHLDVMEHLFEPFEALREIERTLRPGGVCLFTVPTYSDQAVSRQVAFREVGRVRIVGEPEYHGNPQSPEGSLVTWRYGYDLPLRITRETGFDVEVRRWHSRSGAIMGSMTEVYLLTKMQISPQLIDEKASQ